MLGDDLYEAVQADPGQSWQERKAQQNRRLFAEHPDQVWVLDDERRGLRLRDVLARHRARLRPPGQQRGRGEPRRRGLGDASCTGAVLEHFRALGLRYAHVDTGLDDAHIPARRAYEAAGFDSQRADGRPLAAALAAEDEPERLVAEEAALELERQRVGQDEPVTSPLGQVDLDAEDAHGWEALGLPVDAGVGVRRAPGRQLPVRDGRAVPVLDLEVGTAMDGAERRGSGTLLALGSDVVVGDDDLRAARPRRRRPPQPATRTASASHPRTHHRSIRASSASASAASLGALGQPRTTLPPFATSTTSPGSRAAKLSQTRSLATTTG